MWSSWKSHTLLVGIQMGIHSRKLFQILIDTEPFHMGCCNILHLGACRVHTWVCWLCQFLELYAYKHVLLWIHVLTCNFNAVRASSSGKASQVSSVLITRLGQMGTVLSPGSPPSPSGGGIGSHDYVTANILYGSQNQFYSSECRTLPSTTLHNFYINN